MMRRMLLPLSALALVIPPVFAQDQREPGADSTGKVYEWQSDGGLAYQYYVPKGYDAAKGVNLTFILHGSNLDRRWGFANHKAGEFRGDDVVVCPDGTTSNGQGGFNFLQGQKDLERLKQLHDELRGLFAVRATFLYGHSQGSFFAFYYAGAYPDAVQGLVGQASGVWIGTGAGKAGHHQAVVLMHGTADPVVPYGQSVGGLTFYTEAKYPRVRLRSLDGWNHWPTQPQTEMQLAWCEAMTTDDPQRAVAALAAFDGQREGVDPVALYQVAQRVLAMDGPDGKAEKAAQEAIDEVAAEAGKHIDAVEKSMGKSKGKALEDKPWVGHLPRLLRHYRGVPVVDEFAGSWQKVLDKQEDVARKHAKDFWQDREARPKDAFVAGLALLDDAFLTRSAANDTVLESLEKWAEDAKAAGLGKAQLKAFKATVPVYRSAVEKGDKAFEKVAKRFR